MQNNSKVSKIRLTAYKNCIKFEENTFSCNGIETCFFFYQNSLTLNSNYSFIFIKRIVTVLYKIVCKQETLSCFLI